VSSSLSATCCLLPLARHACRYSDLACSGQGLIWSPEPWSGKIGVVDTVWVAAHTTQFTKPGWRYIRQNQGSGYLPAQTDINSLPRTVTMEACEASSASQRWGWFDVASAAVVRETPFWSQFILKMIFLPR
jgi:hypothetical protein